MYYIATTRNFINSISVFFVLLSTHFIKFNCIATKRKCIHSICKLLCGFIAVFSLSFSLFTTLCKPSYKFSHFFYSLSQTDPYCLYFSLSFSFAWGAVFMWMCVLIAPFFSSSSCSVVVYSFGCIFNHKFNWLKLTPATYNSHYTTKANVPARFFPTSAHKIIGSRTLYCVRFK